MAAADTFAAWLAQAQVPEPRLTPEQRALLQATFRFRQQQGTDYYATRLLGHFLLHCGSGLKVAHIARLLGLSRPTASRQQGLPAKQVIQQAHHRLDGRPYGKLLPRYAGPVAEFRLTHPTASRHDLLDFIGRTFGIRAGRTALYHFLKRFGLDRVPAAAAADPPAPPVTVGPTPTVPAVPATAPPPAPVPRPAPPFCSGGRSTPAPSSCCPRR
jgi:hypothetical protein